tara:strand:- start:2611 stop:3879 length:1269 start_codon:yes stop_codon:yes gene_type:complete
MFTDNKPKLSDKRKEAIDEDLRAYLELIEIAKCLMEDKVPIMQRLATLRSQARQLAMPLTEGKIISIHAQARREMEGIEEGEDPDVELDIPEEVWLWEDLIAEGTLNLVVALPKVGKSSLVSAFLGALTSENTEYLGKQIKSKKRSLYICGTDQPLADWEKILVPVGLMERTGKGKAKILQPVKKLWHKGKPFHLTEERIEQLASLIKEDPNSIVVLDAFASLITGIGLDENHADAVEPIRLLYEALAPYNSTLILLHHASSTNDGERAVKASRGTKALPAEASQIIQLSWLMPDNKSDNRVAVNTEGRNSKPVDMVIEQVDKSFWIDHGSSAEIAEELRLEKVKSKLSERQSLVLTFVEQRKEEHGLNTTSNDLVENLNDELNSKTKALAVLTQLEDKKLLQSKKRSEPEKGIVKFFFPPE